MREYVQVAVAGDGGIAKWLGHRLGRGHYVRQRVLAGWEGAMPSLRTRRQAAEISGEVMDSDGNIVAAGDAGAKWC